MKRNKETKEEVQKFTSLGGTQASVNVGARKKRKVLELREK